MAFESMERPYKKASEMNIGDTVTGYVTGFYNSKLYPDVNNLEMETKAGEKFILTVTGTLKYFKDRLYPLGIMYKLTRENDSTKVTPGKKPQKVFKVEGDRTDVHPTFKTVQTIDPTTVTVPLPTISTVNVDKIPF